LGICSCTFGSREITERAKQRIKLKEMRNFPRRQEAPLEKNFRKIFKNYKKKY